MVAVVLLGVFLAAKPANATEVELYAAADNELRVFHVDNIGRSFDFVGAATKWWEQVKYTITVNTGDVILVYAKDLGALYGVTAALVSANGECVTKVGAGPWRAVNLGLNRNETQRTIFDTFSSVASSLPFPTAATAVKPGPGTVVCGCSSSETAEAEYVWAEGAGENGEIGLRLDITNSLECM